MNSVVSRENMTSDLLRLVKAAESDPEWFWNNVMDGRDRQLSDKLVPTDSDDLALALCGRVYKFVLDEEEEKYVVFDLGEDDQY
jgi:hypothetical protein